MPPSMTPLRPPVGPSQPFTTTPLPVVEGGPLEGLQESIAGALNSADSHHVYLPGPQGSMLTYSRGRQSSIAGDMAKGALLGFGAWALWRGMQRRKARVGEFTTPFARFLMIWWGFMAIAFGLSMMWPLGAMKFMAVAFVLGTASAMAYLIYRATGHGKYNTRRGAHRAF